MKNYIANTSGDWATSAAFVRHSFERSIHHGRLYTNGHGLFKGKDEDLAEALRCLGQGLHTLEDFGAHTNYVELALREIGFRDVFAHTGINTMINLRGQHVYPLVTGTFGMVDFYHSVLGEATDHFTQSEVNEMDNALSTAQAAAQSSNPVLTLVKLLSKIPGTRDLCAQAEQLQRASDIQAHQNSRELGGGQQQQQRDGSKDVGDYPDGHGLGAQDHSHVLQPDWSGLEVVHPQQNEGFNQQSDWNQQQQPGYGQQQSHWPQNQQQPSSSYGQSHSLNYNEQQAAMASFQTNSGSETSSFHQPSNFDGSDQPQQLGQNFGQQISVFDQQQDISQYQNQPFNYDGPAVNIQPTPSNSQQTPSAPPMGLPGLPNFDPAKTIAQIYPILAFRDNVVRTISAIIEKIPGLEALVEKITETLTVFILSLLAPFVRPVIEALTKTLQTGSGEVVQSSAKQQFAPWTDPNCSDPTHSMLSKDHFSNILNPPAGAVAAEILKYVAPRVLYAWQNPGVPVDQVLNDCMKVFHHPAVRDMSIEVHRTMFEAVRKWIQSLPDRGDSLNQVLSSESVRNGKNHQAGVNEGHSHNSAPSFGNMGMPGSGSGGAGGFHQQPGHNAWGGHQGNNGGNSGFNPLAQLSSLPIPGLQDMSSQINKFSSLIPGGFGGGLNRGLDGEDYGPSRGLGPQNQEMTREGMTRQESFGSGDFMPPTGYEGYEGRSRTGSYQPSNDTQDYYGSHYGGGRSDN
jgi:hypothetical protein